MTNKYLEKIAEMRRIGPGVYEHDGDKPEGRGWMKYRNGAYVNDFAHISTDKATGDKLVDSADKKHIGKAFKTLPAGFAVTGALLAAIAGGKQWIKHPVRTAKVAAGVTAAAGALGAALAYPLARTGNKQKPRDIKIYNETFK